MLFILSKVEAQTIIKGKIADEQSRQPVEGVTIRLLPSGKVSVSDAGGNFVFRGIRDVPSEIVFSSIGFTKKKMQFDDFKNNGYRTTMTAEQVELANVTISSHAGEQFKPISRTDIAMRGVNNSQEVLRIIPGLVIGPNAAALPRKY